MSKLKKQFHDWMDTETVYTGETYYREEDIYIDETLVKNKSLVRIDMNIVQFPIFSKNTKRRKNEITTYYFNKNKNTYITVKPSTGEYIPGETEETIFIALMQIMKNKGMPQEFHTTSSEIKEISKITSGNYGSIIKKALLRLSETNYNFKNTMYSNTYGGVITDEVSTPILTFRAKKLSDKKNSTLKEKIKDNRVKEAFWIKISDHFFNNMVKKGYLVYNSNLLLEINSSIARTIYMLIEKLRFQELYLKVDTIFLIKRIPLKYSKRDFNKTIKTLEKAFDELKNKFLIENFNFIKTSTWEKSEIEIFFLENSNEEKQERFFEDLNDFRKISKDFSVSEMEHSKLEKNLEDAEIIEEVVTGNMIEEVLELMPLKARSLKTINKTIKDSIEKYGYEKVKNTAIYMKDKNVEKVRGYFLKALENNWAIEDEKKLILQKEIKKSSVEFKKEEIIPKYNGSLYYEFEKLPENIKNGIETYVYRDYIQKCGMESKIQEIAFIGSRKKYISEYLEKYPEILGGEENKKELKISDNTIENMDDLKKYVDIYIKNYSEFLGIKLPDIDELKKKIIFEIMDMFIEKKLTNEKLKEVIENNLR